MALSLIEIIVKTKRNRIFFFRIFFFICAKIEKKNIGQNLVSPVTNFNAFGFKKMTLFFVHNAHAKE